MHPSLKLKALFLLLLASFLAMTAVVLCCGLKSALGLEKGWLTERLILTEPNVSPLGLKFLPVIKTASAFDFGGIDVRTNISQIKASLEPLTNALANEMTGRKTTDAEILDLMVTIREHLKKDNFTNIQTTYHASATESGIVSLTVLAESTQKQQHAARKVPPLTATMAEPEYTQKMAVASLLTNTATPRMPQPPEAPSRFTFKYMQLLHTPQMQQAVKDTSNQQTTKKIPAKIRLTEDIQEVKIRQPWVKQLQPADARKEQTPVQSESQSVKKAVSEPTKPPQATEDDTSLKARIARELLAFAPRLEDDSRLDAVSRHLSNRAQQALKNRSREAVDAWLHREVYGLLFSAAGNAPHATKSTTRAEEMLARAADHLALSFTETSQQLMGQMQASAFAGEPGQAFAGMETQLREDVIAALIGSGEAIARASGIAALTNMELRYALADGDVSRFSVLAVQPLRSSLDNSHNLFAQGSWFHERGVDGAGVRNTANLGLGYRYMTPDEKHLMGVNAFYDHEFPYHHQRASLGIEYLNSLIGLRANRYFRLSGYKDVDDGFGFQERALGGWDVALSGRPPQIPQLQLFLRGFTWEREATEFLNPTGKDISGHEIRAEYTPFPALTLEAGLRNDNTSDDAETLVGARFNYALGGDMLAQLQPQQHFELASMLNRRFQKVRRENLIQKQKRLNPDGIAEVLTLTGTLTVTPPSGAAFSASVGDHIRFGSTLQVSNGGSDIAELLFGDGGFLRIGDDTTVRYEQGELELLTNGILQFTSGSTSVNLTVAGESVSLLGTDVELRRGSSNKTTLRVRDGAALITNSNGTLTLNVQEMGLADNGNAPVPVTRSNPDFTAHVTDAVDKLNIPTSSIASTNLAPYVPDPVTMGGAVMVGSPLTFTVTTTQVVNVTGTPELVIDVGGTERRAVYQSGSGSTSLTFDYTLQSGDVGATSIEAEYIDFVSGSDITAGTGRKLVPDVTGTFAISLNNSPTFDTTSPTNLPVVVNTSSNIGSLLAVTDSDTGDTLTWAVATTPTNGNLGGFPTTATSTGASVTPTGLTYTPNTGFTGADSFAVQISDGTNTDTLTVNVSVNSEYDDIKPLEVTTAPGNPTIAQALPVKIIGGADSTTGTGDVVIDWTNVSSPADIAILDSDQNPMDYWIEEFDTSTETAVVHVYSNWLRNGTVQAQVAYGNGPGDQSSTRQTVFDQVTGLAAGYAFNETSGNALDLTSNNNHGTVNDATQGVPGVTGGGYSFDGSNDFVSLTPGVLSAVSLSDFTISTWVFRQATANDTFVGFISNSFTNFILIRNNSTFPNFRLRNNSGNVLDLNSPPISTGVWTLVTATYNRTSGQAEIFYDGVLQDSQTFANTDIDVTGENPRIGSDGRGTDFFNGRMDDLRIYSATLSPDEIQASFDASKAIPSFFDQQAPLP